MIQFVRVSRFQLAFAALMLTQTVHSIEECVGRLWETFPPARLVSSLASSDPQRGFIALNVLLIMIGWWCFLGPVRQRWPSAAVIAWVWVVIEVVNGLTHLVVASRVGGYAPGVATAPFLLILAIYLSRQIGGRGPRNARHRFPSDRPSR